MANGVSGISARDVAEVSGAHASAHATRITVVDDSDDFIGLMEDVLGDRFDVTGILPRSIDEIAATAPEILLVDLFVRNDGVLGGEELVGQSRRHRLLREVPIIVCTGARGADLERLTTVPGVHFLGKPFDLETLESTVRRAMLTGHA
jgi:CheY-like chemotaxis protein